MRYAYPCELTRERDGGFSVSFPNVPEALTCGDDQAEALAMAEDALAVALGAYVRAREDIPSPGPVLPGQGVVAVPLVASPGFELLVATRRHAAILEQTVAELPDIRGNQMHDLHTAVLMREHGVSRICTRDTGFHRFPFLTVVDPLRRGTGG